MQTLFLSHIHPEKLRFFGPRGIFRNWVPHIVVPCHSMIIGLIGQLPGQVVFFVCRRLGLAVGQTRSLLTKLIQRKQRAYWLILKSQSRKIVMNELLLFTSILENQ